MPYFAKFVQHSGAVFRLDTRIYLAGDASPGDHDECIAAIVAKNPGSASAVRFGAFSRIELHGDKMLPSVRNRFLAAFERAAKPIPRTTFVRVWNLFYLCDPDLQSAMRNLAAIIRPLSCNTERTLPPIVWFAWGGSNKLLDPMKGRFVTKMIARPFFFDKTKLKIIGTIPRSGDFAKHPQGLQEAPIVDFLAKNL